MSRTFSLEDPGEGIHEAEVVELLVAEGDSIAEDDPVMVVTTDKADSELPSPFGGTIETVHVDVGDIVEVGDPLVTFADGRADGDRAQDETDQDETDQDETDQNETDQNETDHEGTERDGTDRDTRTQQQAPEPDRRREQEERASDEQRSARRGDDRPAVPVPASPATRRLARELSVDLNSVDGSGPGGRILSDDVREAAEHGARPGQEEDQDLEPVDQQEEPDEQERTRAREEQEPETAAQPLRGWRRATARRVSESWQTIPHVTHMDRADITDLEAFRAEQAPDVTMTSFIVKATIGALGEHPRFNATYRDDELEVRPDRQIGVAVDTERGLIVPILTDADRRSLREIGDELGRLGERARSGSLERDELRGGTFTITNIGPLGGTAFTPIIVPPQVAILGLARATRSPVVADDEIAIRTMLPICLAFDHRINDGADAARFVSTIVNLLEDPDELLLRS